MRIPRFNMLVGCLILFLGIHGHMPSLFDACLKGGLRGVQLNLI